MDAFQAIAFLKDLGWQIEPVSRRQASLYVDTAAGGRYATVYAYDSSENGVYVHGEYMSEGRDALASTSVFIPVAATLEQAQCAMLEFDSRARDSIDETYARSLLLRRQRAADRPG